MKSDLLQPAPVVGAAGQTPGGGEAAAARGRRALERGLAMRETGHG